MAYENKPKVIRDKDKERSAEERFSLARQRARRELNERKKQLQREEAEQLREFSGSTTADARERRDIKSKADAALEQAEANFTETYNPSQNKQDYESDVLQRGIDQFTAPEATDQSGSSNTFTLDVVKSDNTAGTATFNGSGVN